MRAQHRGQEHRVSPGVFTQHTATAGGQLGLWGESSPPEGSEMGEVGSPSSMGECGSPQRPWYQDHVGQHSRLGILGSRFPAGGPASLLSGGWADGWKDRCCPAGRWVVVGALYSPSHLPLAMPVWPSWLGAENSAEAGDRRLPWVQLALRTHKSSSLLIHKL